MIVSNKRLEADKKPTQSERQAALDMPPPPPPQRAPSSGPVRPPPGMAVAPSRPMPHLTRPGLASNTNTAGFDATRSQPSGPSRPTAQRPVSVTLSSSTQSERPKSPDAADGFDPTKSVPASHLTRDPKPSVDMPRRAAKAAEPPKIAHSRQGSRDEKGKQVASVSSAHEQQKKHERKQIDLHHNVMAKRANELRRKEVPTEKSNLASSTSSVSSNVHPRPPSRTDTRPSSRSEVRPPSRSEVRSARLRTALTSSSSTKSTAVPTNSTEEGHKQPFRPSSRSSAAPEQTKVSATEPEKEAGEDPSAESTEQAAQERKERRARKEKEREKEKEKMIRSKKSVADLGTTVGHDQADDKVQKRQARRRRQEIPQEKVETDVVPVQPEVAEDRVDADLQCILTVTAPSTQSSVQAIPDNQSSSQSQPIINDAPENVSESASLPVQDYQGEVKSETHPASNPGTGRTEGEDTIKQDVSPPAIMPTEPISAQKVVDALPAVASDEAIIDADSISEKTPVKRTETSAEAVPAEDVAKAPTMPRIKAGRTYATPPPVIRPLLIKKSKMGRRIASGQDNAGLFMPKLGPDADAESDEERAQLFASDVPLPESPEPDRAFLLPLEQQMCTPAPLRTAVTTKYAGGVAATPISKLLQSIQHGFDVSVISEISEEDEDAENLALPYIPPQEAQSLGSLASSDMVFSMFGTSQGDIHGFPFMDRAINDFKGLTISGDECDNRFPLIPLIDN